MSVHWNVGYIVQKRAEMSPDKPCLIFEDKPVTYKELNEGVNRAAHFLHIVSGHPVERLVDVAQCFSIAPLFQGQPGQFHQAVNRALLTAHLAIQAQRRPAGASCRLQPFG